jgi:hypothetical protein
VDPLRVVRRQSELVDPRLVYLEPLGRAELLPEQLRECAHPVGFSSFDMAAPPGAAPQRTVLAAHV